MARKTKLITVEADNRDKGRTYLITELSARDAERWATHVLLAMQRSGVDVPDEAFQAGAAAIMATGLRALVGIRAEDADPLLDQMLACVQFVPDKSKPDMVRPLIEDDIDEVQTLLWLRGEVVEVHTGFSVTAALATLGAAAKVSPLNRTSTSRKVSPRSSRPAKPRSTSSKRSTA